MNAEMGAMRCVYPWPYLVLLSCATLVHAARVSRDMVGGVNQSSVAPLHIDADGDDVGGFPTSAIQKTGASGSIADPSVLADIAPLLGECPKDSKGVDIDEAWCNEEQTIKCCNHACRIRTSMRDNLFGPSKPMEVPNDTVQKLLAVGRHPSEACCRENIYLGSDGRWTCRKAKMAFKELIEQIPRGPMEHRWESLGQAVVELYERGLAKLESRFEFQRFYQQGPVTKGEVRSKPLVMVIGDYSAGKTTFIRDLIGTEYRGMHIGVEPTTDRFTIIQYGAEESMTPGEILAIDKENGFESLSQFGNGFLRSFQGAKVNSPVLREYSLLDTPGVLSGQKQSSRDYDFEKASRWFADRADIILLFFDVHKTDISDETKAVVQNLGPNQAKVRIMLNKVDTLGPVSLLRSYGALMFGLGRVFTTPELKRIYLGSFRKEEYDVASEVLHPVFKEDKELLMNELTHLAKEAVMQKVNSFIQRIKLAKAHATLLDYLRQQMPSMWGSEKKKNEMVAGLAQIYKQLEGTNGLAPGDLPEVSDMQEKLRHLDFGTITSLKETWVKRADEVLQEMSALTAAAKMAFSDTGE